MKRNTKTLLKAVASLIVFLIEVYVFLISDADRNILSSDGQHYMWFNIFMIFTHILGIGIFGTLTVDNFSEFFSANKVRAERNDRVKSKIAEIAKSKKNAEKNKKEDDKKIKDYLN